MEATSTNNVYRLDVVDYVVLGVMLLLSASTGIYSAVFSTGKQRTTHEYLLGNRQLGAFPVGVSVFISVISAVTFIGTPAEVYVNGPTFWLSGPRSIIVGLIITRTFIPVFYRLHVTSIFEYLEMRFNRVVRLMSVAISLLFGFIYMSFVIYAPALAVSAITNLNVNISILLMGVVCTFYSSIGGIKAVIWADVLQAGVMVLGLITVVIVGCVRVGGVDEVIRLLNEGNRNQFVDFDSNPTIRHSFWAIMIGGLFQAVYTSGVNQLVVQRHLSCKTEQGAKLSAWIGVAGIAFAQIMACACGLVIFAFYAKCDPKRQGRISTHDEIMPLFIVDLVGNIRGLSGLLLSSVFSASLSTVSSGVNAVSANIAEDLLKPHFKYKERCLTVTTKVIAALCGLLATGLAYVARLFATNLLQAVLAFIGILSGPLLGVFSLGMFFPYGNSKGAVTGLISGALLGWFLLFGSVFLPLPLTNQLGYIDYNCTAPNITVFEPMTTLIATTEFAEVSPDLPVPWWLIQLCNISYQYYGCLTWVLTVLVGIIVSLISGPMDPRDLNPDLFCPLIKPFCCCLPDKFTSWYFPSVGENFGKKTGHDNEAYEVEVNGGVESSHAPLTLHLNEATNDTRF